MKSALAVGVFAAVASAAVEECANLPTINSEELQAAVTTDALLQGCEQLMKFAEATPARNRQMGTKGHNLTTDWLVEELEKLDDYYTIETQTFWYNTMLNGTLSLKIDGESADGGLIDYSPTGDVSAPVVVVNNLGCDTSDYPATVSGKVALVVRGTCPFSQKSALAGAAGAVGALVYNNIPGRLEATLGPDPRSEGPFVPTIGISDTQGQDLVTALTGGASITASLHVETDIKNLSTSNVIATSKCGSSDSVLMLGAHTDSVFRGPGIDDNGSGVIALLEVAKSLARYTVSNAVRFAWWTGEEPGMLGAWHYVDGLSEEDKSKIGAYLNFDTIASPNHMNGIYDDDGPTGSADIFHFWQGYFESKGQNHTAYPLQNGRSDQVPFLDAGIASGGLFTGADGIKTEEEEILFGGTAGKPYDSNFHTAGDDVSNLNLPVFTLHARGIAAAVAEFATSLPSTASPKRSVPVAKRETKRSMNTCSHHI